MQEISKALHVGELLVGADGAVRIAFGRLPGVVHVDVGIAVVGQSLVYDGLGRRHHFLLGNAGTPAVPGVPAHGRGERYLVADFQGELLTDGSVGVLRHKRHGIVALFQHFAAQDALCGIDGRSLRKILHRETHRAFAREWQPENDGRSGTHTVHQRSVVARGKRSWGRQDILGAVKSFEFLSGGGIGKHHIESALSVSVTGKGHVAGLAGFQFQLFIDDLGSFLLVDHGDAGFQRARVVALGKEPHAAVSPGVVDKGKGHEIVEPRFDELDFGLIESAGSVSVIYPHGKQVVCAPFDLFRWNEVSPAHLPCALVPFGTVGKFTRGTDHGAVEPALVAVVHKAHVKGDISIQRQLVLFSGRDGEMEAVPCEAAGNRISLVVPGVGQIDGGPCTVVERDLLPGRIVPYGKKPFVQGKVLRPGAQ